MRLSALDTHSTPAEQETTHAIAMAIGTRVFSVISLLSLSSLIGFVVTSLKSIAVVFTVLLRALVVPLFGYLHLISLVLVIYGASCFIAVEEPLRE